MANTYHQILLQFVFAVKYRKAMIDNSWKKKLFGVIGNLINESNCKNIIVNGVEDHVHCLVGLKPKVSPSDLMQTVKGKSSKFINDHNLTPNHFEWQVGFGVFSYNHVNLDRIFKYIQSQEEHHKIFTLREEYLLLLKEFNIEFDEQYLFHDPL